MTTIKNTVWKDKGLVNGIFQNSLNLKAWFDQCYSSIKYTWCIKASQMRVLNREMQDLSSSITLGLIQGSVSWKWCGSQLYPTPWLPLCAALWVICGSFEFCSLLLPHSSPSSSSVLLALSRWKQWIVEAKKKLAIMAATEMQIPEKITMR